MSEFKLVLFDSNSELGHMGRQFKLALAWNGWYLVSYSAKKGLFLRSNMLKTQGGKLEVTDPRCGICENPVSHQRWFFGVNSKDSISSSGYLLQDQRMTRATHVACCAVSIRHIRNSSIVDNIKINTGNVYCTYLTMSIAVSWSALVK